MKRYTKEEVLECYETFTNDKFSLIVSSVDEENKPLTSYAPFVKEENTYYICVSSQLPHFKNMMYHKSAHVMIVQDEQDASHIYARQRLYFDATCEIVTQKKSIFKLFDERFGEALSFIKTMEDFEVISLKPKDKSFVLGFGAAYIIDEKNNIKNKTILHKKK